MCRGKIEDTNNLHLVYLLNEGLKDDVGDDFKMYSGAVHLAFWALAAFDSRKGPVFLCQRLSSHFAERPRWIEVSHSLHPSLQIDSFPPESEEEWK